MVQFLDVPETPTSLYMRNYKQPYQSTNARSFINGFYCNSARDSRDFTNLSSYTKRSNSEYALPIVCQETPPLIVTPPTSHVPTPPSYVYKRRFERLATPIVNIVTSSANSQSLQQQNHRNENQNIPKLIEDSGYFKYVSKLETLHIFGAEFLGTAIFLFLGCAPRGDNMMWTFAIAALTAIHIFGPISGGHINPGCTIVALIMGHIPNLRLIPIYWLAQLLGATAGYALHFALVLNHNSNKSLCITKPPNGMPFIKVLLIETIMSFIFFMAVAALFDSKHKYNSDTSAMKFGFILLGCIYSMLGVVPISMNTARSVAPAIINYDFEGHVIYWIGPNIGAIMAGVIYRYFFNNRPYLEKEEKMIIITK